MHGVYEVRFLIMLMIEFIIIVVYFDSLFRDWGYDPVTASQASAMVGVMSSLSHAYNPLSMGEGVRILYSNSLWDSGQMLFVYFHPYTVKLFITTYFIVLLSMVDWNTFTFCFDEGSLFPDESADDDSVETYEDLPARGFAELQGRRHPQVLEVIHEGPQVDEADLETNNVNMRDFHR